MHWPHWPIKILRYFQKWWRLEIFHTYRSRCVAGRKTSKNPKFVYPSIEKKCIKICAILFNWKTANRIEAGVSLNKRAKRAENKSDCHHARSRFWDIRLQFTSVRLMWKTVFLAFFQCFPRTLMKLFRFLII